LNVCFDCKITRVKGLWYPTLRVGITATRTVLLDGPLVFDLERVMAGGLPFAFEGRAVTHSRGVSDWLHGTYWLL
jgi:hypothetical protein